MKTEFISIEYARYRDSKDYPTCSRNFTAREYCPFFGTRRWGIEECCMYPQDREVPDRQSVTTLCRRNGGEGSIEPREGCPLWRDK